jgi:hypothetical protein
MSQKITWRAHYATWFVCDDDWVMVWSLSSYVKKNIAESIFVLTVDFGTHEDQLFVQTSLAFVGLLGRKRLN